MANNKPRTNWSDKIRRNTGIVTFCVIVLVVLLCIFLPNKKEVEKPRDYPSSTATAPLNTDEKIAIEDKTPQSAPVTTEKEEPAIVVEEPVVEKKEEESIVKEAPIFVEPVATLEESIEIVEEIKEEPVEDFTEEIKEEVEVETNEEPKVIPVIEEAEVQPVISTASFDVYGYTIDCSWDGESFRAESKTKGIVTDSDVMSFYLYEVGKYGSMLFNNIDFSLVSDGFKFSYNSAINPEDYISDLQSEIKEYVDIYLASSDIKTTESEVAYESEDVEEINSSSFDIYGYGVDCLWTEEGIAVLSETKGLIAIEDVTAFAFYEYGKYGSLIIDNMDVYWVEDGMVLIFKGKLDPEPYIPTLQSEIKEFVDTYLAQESVSETKVPTISKVVVESSYSVEGSSFNIYGYKVTSYWSDNKFTSIADDRIIISEDDIRAFAIYALNKYSYLSDYTSIEFVPNGFVLTYPEGVNPRDYISLYKDLLNEYVETLFVVEAPKIEEAASIVEEKEESKTEIVEITEAIVEEKDEQPESIGIIGGADGPTSIIVASPQTPEVKVEIVEEKPEEKLKKNKVKFGLGVDTDFGKNFCVILPRLNMSYERFNIFGKTFGLGGRLDVSTTVAPLSMEITNNRLTGFADPSSWRFDVLVSGKVMAYVNFKSAQLYGGIGFGYYLASSDHYLSKHAVRNDIDNMKSAFVLSAVAGFDIKLGRSVSLFGECEYKYFIESTEKSNVISASIGVGIWF